MSLARERIERLFELADEVHDENPERAERYVERAREIATSERVRMPSHLKRRYCGSCGAHLVPGDNARVRLRSDRGHVVVRCKECGATERYGYG
ncbi:MAG: ribonuclease P protein component 4 [Halobacteria archaeon]